MLRTSALGASALGAILLTACTAGQPDAGFSFSPPTTPGGISGYVLAVYAPLDDEVLAPPVPDGGVLLRAGTCRDRAGEHDGFLVHLRQDSADAGEREVTVETDAEGRFVFADVAPGRYLLHIDRPGFTLPLPARATVAPGESVSLSPLCALWAERPPAPSDLDVTAADAGTLDVTFSSPPGATAAPLTWLVSYGADHTADVVEGCPHGAPPDDDGDEHEIGVFAAEGPSPLLVDVPRATLTGAPSQTGVSVQVAARDPLKNYSCWTPPVIGTTR